MPAEIIDGASIAARIRADLRVEVADFAQQGTIPRLVVVLVGDDAASAVYVAAKGRACLEVGMDENTVLLPATTSQAELLTLLDSLNADPSVHGILVQSPLPKHIDAAAVIRRIHPSKDVDGFHPLNVGKLLAGERDGFAPCTPAGIQELIRCYDIETHGANCVVVGRSNIVGKPMAALMIQDGRTANATVTICHRYTRDLAMHTRNADILITAVGKPGLITAQMVKAGAAVLDVGITRISDPTRMSGTRLVGDVDFATVRDVAGYITPVPGGVGPMTIAMLLRNTLRAAQRLAAA
ncbi:MAG: bifunctional 5,10-methylenetetrahydrofolate dehydrogenase/5,10-methenyltetrahydrofolate cyclohydrolase [Gemmatimonadota bacterium]|nr:bifunctional 5,10-methylenetetrahydrofolate dehydrogenase/5,10-methenyltetrahydrofolate cyclohydrolase [Gemmatimonadota bacterium]